MSHEAVCCLLLAYPHVQQCPDCWCVVLRVGAASARRLVTEMVLLVEAIDNHPVPHLAIIASISSL